jgi:hypothetical protein
LAAFGDKLAVFESFERCVERSIGEVGLFHQLLTSEFAIVSLEDVQDVLAAGRQAIDVP